MMKEIAHTMAHFDGEVKEGVIWPIPGFCLPMEVSLISNNSNRDFLCDIETYFVFCTCVDASI